MAAPTAVLIGFQYSRSAQERLVGTIVDLYRAYRYTRKIGCEQVLIITDIEHTDFPLEIITAIAKKAADGGIITFLQTYPALVVTTIDGFRSALTQIPSGGKLVAYYSGHGANHTLILPDGNPFDMHTFRDTLLEHLDHNGELFCIVDCCHSHGLFLPFAFEQKDFQLREGYLNFLRPRIMLLTSSQEHRDSQSTHLGSVFSRFLFDWLGQGNGLRLYQLRQDISKKMTDEESSTQHIGIYTSWKEVPLLWPWVVGRLDWNVDLATGCLRLRRSSTYESPSSTYESPSDTKAFDLIPTEIGKEQEQDPVGDGPDGQESENVSLSQDRQDRQDTSGSTETEGTVEDQNHNTEQSP